MADGSAANSSTEARPHFIAVRSGTLDKPEISRPDLTIWTSSAPSWAFFAKDLPQEAKQPGPPAVSGDPVERTPRIFPIASHLGSRR